MPNKTMQSLFRHLHFSDKEELVFMTILQTGPSAASTLARLTNIKRTSIYDILNQLLERNLLITYKQQGTTFYAIDDINKLVHEEKDRVRSAEALVTELQKLQHWDQGIQVHYYRGIEGFREMYEDILRAPVAEIQAWVNLDTFYSGLDMERELEWTRERVRQKKYARLLILDSLQARSFQQEDGINYRETRLFPVGTNFSPTCFLYDNVVTFFSSDEPMVGIRINNPQIYQMQRQFFDLHWQNLKR